MGRTVVFATDLDTLSCTITETIDGVATAGLRSGTVPGKATARTMAVHFYILAREGISMEMAYSTGAMLIVIINLAANRLKQKRTQRPN